MDRGPLRSSAPFVGLIFLVALLGAAFVFHRLPRWKAERRALNERNAVLALCNFTAIQEEFRRKDLDRNGVSDYWTGDVAGLLQYGLIDRSLAEADASPVVPLCPHPIPWNGYFVVALNADSPPNPPDKSSPYPPADWAVCFYPAEPGRTGTYIYINSSVSGRRRTPATKPPPRTWPSDAELRTWSQWD
jgi:hypothetical protein